MYVPFYCHLVYLMKLVYFPVLLSLYQEKSGNPGNELDKQCAKSAGLTFRTWLERERKNK
jgi:hypothetical protein